MGIVSKQDADRLGELTLEQFLAEADLVKIQEQLERGLAIFFHGPNDHAEEAIITATEKLMGDMQPPTSVAELAGKAAAAVLMAFERGYRMG